MTTQRQHQPLPYRLHLEDDEVWSLKDAEDEIVVETDTGIYNPKLPTATFIVKACNSHYELLEACKATLVSIQGADDQLERKLKQAISKAESQL